MVNPDHPGKERQTDPLLAQAFAALRTDDREQAREMLAQRANQQPGSAQAWLWLAYLTPEPRQARTYAHTALRIDPDNRRALSLLRQLEQSKVKDTQVRGRTWSPRLGRWQRREPGMGEQEQHDTSPRHCVCQPHTSGGLDADARSSRTSQSTPAEAARSVGGT